MDERVEKAFAVVNYMATLSNQRRIITEEYQQQLVYYTNGATFKVTPELISFTKTVIDYFLYSKVKIKDIMTRAIYADSTNGVSLGLVEQKIS